MKRPTRTNIPSHALALLASITFAALVTGCAKPSPPPTAAAPSVSKSTQLTYELSEKCGRAAREWFKQLYGDGNDGPMGNGTQSTFHSHYNAQRNACFAVVTTTGELKATAKSSGKMSEAKSLFDVNESNELGSYFKFVMPEPEHVMMCKLGETFCKTSDEWDEMVAPYMTE